MLYHIRTCHIKLYQSISLFRIIWSHNIILYETIISYNIRACHVISYHIKSYNIYHTIISYITYHMSYIIYYMSHIICHMSYIIYHISHITHHISYIIYHISCIIYHIYLLRKIREHGPYHRGTCRHVEPQAKPRDAQIATTKVAGKLSSENGWFMTWKIHL